jgi:hypothetical protein
MSFRNLDRRFRLSRQPPASQVYTQATGICIRRVGLALLLRRGMRLGMVREGMGSIRALEI